MVDNEIANEYWEYKLPQGFKKPSENSPAEVAWKFIQDKYVRKSFVPKNAVDPAAEWRENRTGGAKPATPPTDDDSVKSGSAKPKKGHKKAVVVEPAEEIATEAAPKVDIKDLLDIEVGPKELAPAPAAKVELQSELWDLLDTHKSRSAPVASAATLPAPSQKPAVPPAASSYKPAAASLQPGAYFYSNPNPSRYAALDQLSHPYASHNGSAMPYMQPPAASNWTGFAPLPAYSFPPVAQPMATAKTGPAAEKSKYDKAFADVLPKDF